MSERTSSAPFPFLSALILALFTGCNESTDPGLGLTIEVTPEATTIDIADTLELVATVRDGSGDLVTGRRVAWASEDPQVAQVTPGGRVAARSEGVAVIRASIGDASGAATITVERFPAASLVVTPEEVVTEPARPVQLTATLRAEDGRVLKGRQLVWASQDEAILEVTSAGEVTGIRRGTAVVTATHGSLQVEIEFQVIFQLTSVVEAIHSCGITATRSVYCWGRNDGGQLGTGSFEGPDECGTGAFPFACATAPVPVALGVEFRNLSAGGQHTCGMDAASSVFCWGVNLSGQLGDGSKTNRPTPVRVATEFFLDTVVAGGAHSCALTTAGNAVCWGNNEAGQLGDGTFTDRTRPIPVAGAPTFRSLTAGADFTCGLTSTGEAYCWGSNLYGQLGIGSFDAPDRCGLDQDEPCSNEPLAVAGGLEFRSLDGGSQLACGVLTDGAAYCWGRNWFGGLGDGTTTDRSQPTAVLGGLSFQTVTAAGSHSCGLEASGVIYCWGVNTGGQLGTGATDGPEGCGRFGQACSRIPVAVADGLSFTSLGPASSSHTCAIAADDRAYCWGSNFGGALGDGSLVEDRPRPVPVFRQ